MDSDRQDAMSRGGEIPTGKLTREFRFLLLATRGADREALRAAAAAGLDWNIIVQGIGRHGLPALARALLADGGMVPTAAAVDLRRRLATQAIETLQRVDEAVRISRAFEARGIRFLMIKGVPLSVQLYGDATRRAARDLDIVVERDRSGDAGEVLKSLGYFRPGGDPATQGDMAPIAKETGFLHSQSRILVELHDRLTDNAALLPWGFEALWLEREKIRVGTQAVPTMARHRLPLYLCVHGAKHCWARLMWLQDLAAVLDGPEAIDRAVADAEALGLGGAMLHALSILHDWFGHPVPPAVLARARASGHVRLLDRQVARFHADPLWYETPPRHSWRRFRQGSVQLRFFAYAMKPKWNYWRHQLVLDLSSPEDRALIALPAGLAWLYPLLRPFGWLARRWKARTR
jgi:hypothetical protein